MVDLDQCTHATINGCDKERRGWYPLPSSLFPSICLPSCPACCPLPNCFSLTPVHLHLHWHLPGGRPSAGTEAPLMAGVADALSPASIHLARPAPWENFEPSFYHAYHEITASSPPRPPSSTYLTLSFSPASALAVSHMLISHSCTHSLQPYSALSASELLCSPWMHRLLCSYHHLMMQHCAHLLTAVWDVCTKNISSFLYATGTLIQYQPKVKSGCLIGYWHKWSESKWVIDRTVKRKWSRSLTEWIPNRNYGWKWARVHAGKQI